MDNTPRSLLDRVCRRSDEMSWKQLVDVYTPFLRGVLRHHGVPDADGDDLMQDVFAVLIREVPQFRHSDRPGAFRTWLRGILVNRLRGYWRGRRNAPAPNGGGDPMKQLDGLEDPSCELSRAWDREHNEHVVRRLLEMLRPEFTLSTWQAFRRHVIDGAEAAAVAEELGLSANAVLIAKSRVLRRLRQESAGLTD